MPDQNNALVMWTVYDHPTDFPNDYVARKWELDHTGVRATDEVILHRRLAAVRMQMRVRGLTCLPRLPMDEPKIVEVWL